MICIFHGRFSFGFHVVEHHELTFLSISSIINYVKLNFVISSTIGISPKSVFSGPLDNAFYKLYQDKEFHRKVERTIISY